VGGRVFALEPRHGVEMEAFQRLRSYVRRLGDGALSLRLERLREDRVIWIAPGLGPERWAVFVEALSLVRRVYIRREALIDPVAHLYRAPRPDIPPSYQEAHAWIGLAGALRHELAHYDGLRDEGAAYERELEWYEGVRRAPLLVGLPEEERRAWEWGIESAVLSARKARDTAR
jgi:hypothetical protein